MGIRLIGKDYVLKAGDQFIGTVKGESHTLEAIVSEDGSRFLLKLDGDETFRSMSAAARAATGWGNANGNYFWKPVTDAKAAVKAVAAKLNAQVIDKPENVIDVDAIVPAGETAKERKVRLQRIRRAAAKLAA
jgi:hypothetical protein